MGQRIPEKEIANFQLGYKIGFINDAEIWLLMLKKRNTSVIYNEDEIDELILLIRDSFILAFTVLKDTLVKKLEEAESDWM
ncbi:nucleotidyltransferase substrate binding protein [Clostridium sp. TF11-13AC]|uniref:nucleotidyltransferase substrate binding protein n=1 Tax=Clostridium sp. TF11-13AC TaxID=2293053 RepID=UPI001FA971A1|nr:nucleotidyltransferase substrate binding protein [Clostridium sp. TF11-13AC]